MQHNDVEVGQFQFMGGQPRSLMLILETIGSGKCKPEVQCTDWTRSESNTWSNYPLYILGVNVIMIRP